MSLKHKLLAKNRKLLKSIDIDGEKVEIRKPTMGDKLGVLEAAQKSGDLDEKNQPKDARAGLRFSARIAACLLFDPESGQRVFGEPDLDSLCEAAWLEENLETLTEVFQPNPEKIRGNSNATPI